MNEYTSKSVVYGQTFAAAVLAAYGARPAAALIATPKVRLSKDPSFSPQPSSTIAALAANEADFSGYTAGGYTPTFTAPLNLATNISGIQATITAIAAVASPFVPNSVYGWWLDDGTNVIAAEAFPTGQVGYFQAPADFLALDLRLPVDLVQATA